MTKILLFLSFSVASLVSCAGGDGTMHNEGGTPPVNDGEVLQYKQALHRCYKTGGSRIVKINGYLQCY
jgi:hypothetical protein